MIKFLRHIRKRMVIERNASLTETRSRTGRYLLYALGEIILVVVGILIALQLNTWKEIRLERIEEDKILMNLNTEFKENLLELERVKILQSKTIHTMDLVFELLKKQDTLYPERSLDSILSISLNSPTWKPSEYALVDLKSSGRLSKLNNENLKKLLFEWTIYYNDLTETQDKVEQTNNELIEYIKNNGSLKNIDGFSEHLEYDKSSLGISNTSLLSDFRFENYIDDKLFILKFAHSKSDKTKSIIKNILDESKIKND